jgi:hypothetical protein
VDPADAATTSDASTSAEASTSAATGAPTDGCVGPSKAPVSCNTDKECWNGNQCDVDVCDLGAPPSPPDPNGRKGTCRWTPRPDGTPCDIPGPAGAHDVCTDGACCPVVTVVTGAR